MSPFLVLTQKTCLMSRKAVRRSRFIWKNSQNSASMCRYASPIKLAP